MSVTNGDAAKDCRFDLLGIGNAIIDVLAPVDPAFLTEHDMISGSMMLIDAERAEALYNKIHREREMGGGSAANTCVVASNMGARVAYLGKVADDAPGRTFAADLQDSGIFFPSSFLTGRIAQEQPTARCLVLVTPDGQRTMNTYLGACVSFGPQDVVEEVVASACVTYLEGYLFDPPHAQDAFRHAASLAHGAGRQVALSLSDPFCVARHRDAFRELVRGHIDILFANEEEICSLYQTEDFTTAMEHAAADTHFAVVTRSGQGSAIIREGERIDVPPVATQVVDTTGAGDAYAAGFLAGWTSGRTLEECGRLGSVAASEIISHYGARPLVNLRQDMEL
ncbi:PfkB domain protein [Gluconacetobacter diazotrophicus PA1 5]|uniref:Inosine-guanosine kinase n=2 Tax=Gluconacetobacter diazotrophicus TaxID=33996 RepID=A9H9C0_GLUDA|nr:adenosine kinase [Gluconacetobacter diazotrophicus]ACI51089.1 PfkB domain protein [Gluconacetobacter diazotrophicus PA1 5]MBB2157005.1 adenosine kinase [Gluconacetobacter diazotrophicus]TWB07636.1 sugar/nucleoside kinase (ribokinase family) [Gluconacetobacter diazotrophicus]CAP54645.1 Inosine-guanosine kinase [Gluconacetobacter diazotrophicus PA1 5]